MTATFVVNGETLPFREGETIAAALSRAGKLEYRTTGSNAARGIFCGMGVCQDCLMEVDDQPNQRACMTYVRPGMVVRNGVERQPLPLNLRARPPATISDLLVETPDVLVVGGGPAGLSAALAAAQNGAGVLLLDERGMPGGQFYKQLGVSDRTDPDRQQRRGMELIARVRAAGVRILENTLVWAGFAPLEFLASGPEGVFMVRPGRAVLATGAYETAWPVPGWTLPGVMTTGAAQTLWRSSRAVPGRRVLIAGNGPLNLQLACELAGAGCEVVGLAEASAGPGLRGLGHIAAMALASPALVCRGIGYELRRKRAGIPFWSRTILAGVERSGGGLVATLRDPAGERRCEADVVCMNYGFEASSELARAMGCRFEYRSGRLVPVTDETGLTTLQDLWVVGDGGRPEGAHAAEAAGTVAGIAASATVTVAGHGAAAPARRAGRSLSRHRRFQKALWSLYRAEGLQPPVTADTLICRCEERSFADAEAAINDGHLSMGDIKRATRIGMGRCQGRYCGPLLQSLLARKCGVVPDELSGFAPRVPVKPIALCDLSRPMVK